MGFMYYETPAALMNKERISSFSEAISKMTEQKSHLLGRGTVREPGLR
jgi:hypothetical protein